MNYIGFILGILFGSIITNLILRSRVEGSLIAIETDDEGLCLFLELSEDPKLIQSKRYVKFKVNTKNHPQK